MLAETNQLTIEIQRNFVFIENMCKWRNGRRNNILNCENNSFDIQALTS